MGVVEALTLKAPRQARARPNMTLSVIVIQLSLKTLHSEVLKCSKVLSILINLIIIREGDPK